MTRLNNPILLPIYIIGRTRPWYMLIAIAKRGDSHTEK